MTAPIFVFSLPRSGSTLAQRILASHAEIATVAEPWLLLPFVYALRNDGVYTEYAQSTGAKAIQDFIRELPAGKGDYYAALRELALRLYGSASGNKSQYFLDKTPRYHLIIKEILEIFPEAKCIILWRNPLAVAASIVRTWARNERWITHRYNIDLYKGVENLVEAVDAKPDRFFHLRYEHMVTEPETVWPSVFSYLGLRYDPFVLERYSGVQFSGSMGDPTGNRKFSRISSDSVDDWVSAFDTPLRRAWARRYLAWIGSDRLRTMGYDENELQHALIGAPSCRVPRLLSDALFMTVGALHGPLDLSGVKRQALRTLSRRRSYAVT
ncbi:sulfotransferase family protein [Algiphilus sp.]|uniref:sulfotransferase family protein n=1 Tax=Algiphilus sp. TaxID=1872431 RepID=UPI003B5224C7